MKTLFLFEEVPEDNYFFELEGNYSHLNDLYINSTSCEEDHLEELTNLVYNKEGVVKITKLNAPTKDWDYFVKCGIIL